MIPTTASRGGTGHLARAAADRLSEQYDVLGVVRHQLFFDPRVPYTKNNSSAAILVQAGGWASLGDIFQQVKALMQADFQPGSDPGLCAAIGNVPRAVTQFGQRAKVDLVTQEEARQLAYRHGLLL